MARILFRGRKLHHSYLRVSDQSVSEIPHGCLSWWISHPPWKADDSYSQLSDSQLDIRAPRWRQVRRKSRQQLGRFFDVLQQICGCRSRVPSEALSSFMRGIENNTYQISRGKELSTGGDLRTAISCSLNLDLSTALAALRPIPVDSDFSLIGSRNSVKCLKMIDRRSSIMIYLEFKSSCFWLPKTV